MADKDFVVKNGIVVSSNVIYAPAATVGTGKVGINNSSPVATLHVTGNGFFSNGLNVNGPLSIGAGSFNGNLSVNGFLTVVNSATFSGNLISNGVLSTFNTNNVFNGTNTTFNSNVFITGSANLTANGITFVNISGTNGTFTHVNAGSINVRGSATVNNALTVNGTATFNSTAIALDPTQNNHIATRKYVLDVGNLKANKTGDTFTGQITISYPSPTIKFEDTDQDDFWIHCNDNRMGFLNPGGGWGCYMDSSSNWNSIGSINILNNYAPPNGAIRLTPNFHMNAGRHNAVIANWDNGLGVAYPAGNWNFVVGDGIGNVKFIVYGNGNATITGDASVNQNFYMNSGYGSLRLAYGVRTWLRFQDTAIIYGGGNVSSVTGTGDGVGYRLRVTFTTPLIDANYAAVWTPNNPVSTFFAPLIQNQTTGYCDVYLNVGTTGVYPRGSLIIVR